jgi:phosphatidylserine/phosphatidylglycerophosphate/cardiolipin synthase-like enzyme
MPPPDAPTAAPTRDTNRSGRRHPLIGVMLAVFCAWLLMAIYQAYKPMPQGLSVSAPLRAGTGLQLLDDRTFVTASGEQVVDQQIFEEVFRLIGQAQQLIVLDMFLWNEFAVDSGYKPLTERLTDELLAARQRRPDIPIVLITDPFNRLYGGLPAPHLDRLEQAGITLVVSDVSQLPASNPLWSGLWHLCCRYIDNSTEGGWLPNPVGEGMVTLRSYLALLNFRANHRKTLIVDEGNTWTGLVTSANPHDASSRHSNNALVFRGAAALDLLASEIPVMAFSGSEATFAWPRPPLAAQKLHEPMVQVLTESRIRDALVALINSSEAGDQLDLEVFYLSHRPTIEALVRASERGVAVRALLDPNKDAFGRQKNGIPNRQSGWDLHAAGVAVRWCATQGEQCHRKWIRLERADGSAEIIIGSANFTRRNLDDLNLETSMRVVAARQAPVMRRASELFERNWRNPGADLYSLPYPEFSDHSRWRYGLYRFMEFSGLSTF